MIFILVHITFNRKVYNAVILCSAPGSYRDGDYRLVGGAYNWEGRVEIFQSGSWEAINDSSWTDEDTDTVCKQLQGTFGNSKLFEIGIIYIFCANLIEVVGSNNEIGSGNNNDTTCNGTEVHCISSPVEIYCRQGYSIRHDKSIVCIIDLVYSTF